MGMILTVLRFLIPHFATEECAIIFLKDLDSDDMEWEIYCMVDELEDDDVGKYDHIAEISVFSWVNIYFIATIKTLFDLDGNILYRGGI